MKTKLIEGSEYENLKISALPTCPTADVNYGGYGYNATDMKAAFDALPLFVLEKLNELIEDIFAEAENSVSGAIKTGIADGHTLQRLFQDIKDGTLASYLSVGGENLLSVINGIKADIEALKGGMFG